jgi:phospholipid/cholesterol/gamma-HCH transport system substrate-binding protein
MNSPAPEQGAISAAWLGQHTLDVLVGALVASAALVASMAAVRPAADLGLIHSSEYVLTADFASVEGLRPGTAVEVAGVPIGEVRSISLLPDERAHAVLAIEQSVAIPATATASVKHRGLIGESFVAITPGKSSAAAVIDLPPGGRIRHTVPPVDFEDLLSAYIFGKV